MLKSLIFGQNSHQALRIQRLLLATSTYCFGMLFVNYCIATGLMHNLNTRHVIAGAIFLNLFFYLAIRLGFNLRARDPSLTIPQITIATIINSYLVCYAGAARGAFLMGYVVILAFGIFKLRPRQIVLIGMLVVLGYAAIIAAEFVTHSAEFNLSLEVLQWLLLLFIYPWFALIAEHIANGRHKLRETNDKLVAVLRENEVALKTIQEQATHDELTGLFNRRYMMSALRQEGSRTDRTREPFCVLMLDIDHFKRINDCVGHLGGDNVLIAVTGLIGAQLRSIDHFSRYGGEEFLVLMPATSLDSAMSAAERIRKCVEEARLVEAENLLDVTLSIGVAEYNATGSVLATLAGADRALYRAKNKGRNRVENWKVTASPSLAARTA